MEAYLAHLDVLYRVCLRRGVERRLMPTAARHNPPAWCAGPAFGCAGFENASLIERPDWTPGIAAQASV